MSTDAPGDARKPLAQRLVDEAVTLVGERGHDALSLREVQRRAGVSPTAAYRHFRDRDALLLAVAQHCAGRLADHIAAAFASAPPAGEDSSAARRRLLAGCEGYLDFATRYPHLYRAIFVSGEQVAELSEPSEAARGSVGEGGYNLLVAALADVVSASGGAPMHRWDPLAVWSCCHGLAMLRLDAALRSLPEDVFAEARDRVLATITSAVPYNAGSADVWS